MWVIPAILLLQAVERIIIGIQYPVCANLQHLPVQLRLEDAVPIIIGIPPPVVVFIQEVLVQLLLMVAEAIITGIWGHVRVGQIHLPVLRLLMDAVPAISGIMRHVHASLQQIIVQLRHPDAAQIIIGTAEAVYANHQIQRQTALNRLAVAEQVIIGIRGCVCVKRDQVRTLIVLLLHLVAEAIITGIPEVARVSRLPLLVIRRHPDAVIITIGTVRHVVAVRWELLRLTVYLR